MKQQDENPTVKNSSMAEAGVGLGQKILNSIRSSQWFVMRGEHRYGPFAYSHVVRLLMQNELTRNDFVWRVDHLTWQKVDDVPEFTDETIRAFLQTPQAGISAQLDRRSARFAVGTSVLAHNDRKLYQARSVELSLRGAGVIIDAAMLPIGEMLKLHFRPNAKLGERFTAFNARGQIVNKFVMEIPGRPNAPIQFKYGIAFKDLDIATELMLRNYLLTKVTPS